MIKRIVFSLIVACMLPTVASAANPKIEAKAQEWVSSLELKDKEKERRVTAVIVEHLTAVDDWYLSHPASSVPEGINPETGRPLNELHRKIIADSAMPKTVHENLMNGLRKDLTEEQVEAILDKYTIGKVDFTMRGYKAIVTDLTPEEEAFILARLKEAREMAVDYKTMRQISAIFEIAKNKCEQHLIENGRNWRALYKAFVNKVKEEKEAKAKQENK